jgi:plasmid stability protein
MKNITVTVDDETYRRARVRAAEADTSVSALVKKFLTEMAAGQSEFDRLKQLEIDTRKRITNFSGADRLSRDEIHERR